MYALVAPPEYLKHLVAIRKKTGISIRKQILDSVSRHIEEFAALSSSAAPRVESRIALADEIASH